MTVRPSLEMRVLWRVSSYADRITGAIARRYRRVLRRDASTAPLPALRTHMTEGELNALFELAARVPENAGILEIGSYLGASACYLAAGAARRNARVFCVDTWQNETVPEGPRDTFAEFTANTRGYAHLITTIRKRSDALTGDEFGRPLDLVFIDGDHSYDAASKDLAIVSAHLREGGIVAWHDVTTFEGVSRAVGEALASAKWQIGGVVDSLVWMRKVETTGFRHPSSGYRKRD